MSSVPLCFFQTTYPLQVSQIIIIWLHVFKVLLFGLCLGFFIIFFFNVLNIFVQIMYLLFLTKQLWVFLCSCLFGFFFLEPVLLKW